MLRVCKNVYFSFLFLCDECIYLKFLFYCLNNSLIFFNFRYYSQHPNEKNGSHGTVDKSEVNFHAGLSKEWWNEKDGPMKALHAMNKIRFFKIIY